MVPNVEGVVFCVSFEKSGQTSNTQHPYNIGGGGSITRKGTVWPKKIYIQTPTPFYLFTKDKYLSLMLSKKLQSVFYNTLNNHEKDGGVEITRPLPHLGPYYFQNGTWYSW